MRTLVSTEGMDRSEWLQWRRKGLGGSDAPAILGMSNYASPLSVWFEKVEGVDDAQAGERARWGNLLEPVVAQEFADRFDVPVVEHKAMFQHPEHDFMLADVDRFIGDDGVLEVKVVDRFMAEEWEDDQVPGRYQVQGQHYLAVTGRAFCDFAALVGGNELIRRTVERDEALIRDLVKFEADFWRLVETGTPPAVDGSATTTALLKERFSIPDPESVAILPERARALVEQRAVAHERLKAAEKDKDRLDNEMRLLLGEAEVGLLPGEDQPVVTWKGGTRRQFHLERFREAHPAIAAEFTTEESTRTLRYPKRKAS